MIYKVSFWVAIATISKQLHICEGTVTPPCSPAQGKAALFRWNLQGLQHDIQIIYGM